MSPTRSNIAPILPRSVSVPLTEKAFEVIVSEAKARGVSPERLILAATLDYLGRSGKTVGAKRSPFVLHFPPHVRGGVLAGAAAAGVSPNQFMIGAAREAIKACAPGDKTARELENA